MQKHTNELIAVQKVLQLFLLFFVTIFRKREIYLSGVRAAIIRDADLDPLYDFYHHLEYDPYGVTDDWWEDVDCDVGWSGVTCDANGAVIGLDIYSSDLEGVIPSSLGDLSALETLDLSDNFMHGYVPSELGKLVKLTYLNFSFNDFDGSIPDSFGRLVKLQFLDLRYNFFLGSIPTSLGDLMSLQFMDLSNNELSGSLPASLGKLSSVVQLYLESNRFSGAIPATLARLTNVELLYLYDNNLEGTIPTQLGNLESLQSLDLSFNYLVGPIITNFRSKTLSYVGFRDNYLSGVARVMKRVSTFCPSTSGLFSGLSLVNNCLNFTSTSQPCYAKQRSAALCVNFCNAYQPGGSCGGQGSCVKSTVIGQFKCLCQSGYRLTGGGFTCAFVTHMTGMGDDPSILTPKFLNPWFRYASTSFLNSRSLKPTWSVALFWNWALELTDWPVPDQSKCSACWAFSPVAAMEAGVALSSPSLIPKPLSVQQIIDCSGSNANCTGGWPGDAFEYSTRLGLPSQAAYPYKGVKSAICKAATAPLTKISHYETVSFYGWLGLLLAVQQQPVMVFIEASSYSFVNYVGGVYSNASCYSNGVDHTVLVVGYDLENATPNWIIRNSWGPTWGEGGYARLAITGGVGTCGINTMPGFYPVVKKSTDPCNTRNFGQTILKNPAGSPGTLNPCGRFPCRVSGTTNRCDCAPPFLEASNVDGSRSCVPASPCTFLPVNPCGIGSCINGQSGAYTCLCPLGYSLGNRAVDNRLTCVTGALATGPQSFVVPAGPTSLRCDQIYQSYGIVKAKFLKQNPLLDCTRPLTAGKVVNVTNAVQCRLPYAINEQDTCSSIAKIFNMKTPLFGPNSPNPDVNCSKKLPPGQQICIISGPTPDLPICTKPYDVRTGQSCATIIQTYFKGNASAFFSINPGFYCDRLGTQLSSFLATPVQVCLAASTFGGRKRGCKGQMKFVKRGDYCRKLYRKMFKGKRRLFREYNPFHCEDIVLTNKFPVCAPL